MRIHWRATLPSDTRWGFETTSQELGIIAMGEFIKVEIDLSKSADISDAPKWVEVCPVSIFKIEDNQPVVVAENEDECTLCMLCIDAFPPGSVVIHKLYEDR